MAKSRGGSGGTRGDRGPRRFTPDEAARAIALLDRRIAEVEAINPRETRVNAPEIPALEDSIRATIRDLFGSGSEEARRHEAFRFARARIAIAGPGDRQEVQGDMQRQFIESHPMALAMLRGLIQRVEERTEGGVTAAPRRTGGEDPAASRRVFVVHGRNEGVKQAVARALEQLDLEAIILHEQADEGRTLIEKFEDHGGEAVFAVILMTGDDRGGPVAAAPESSRPRARQTVVLELGYFRGILGKRRVCVLFEPDVEMPSDYAGVLYKKLDEAGAWRLELARELRAAGIPVNVEGLIS